MQSFFLSYKSSRIHYLQGGHGNKLLLCFHGYGKTADSFAFLETSLAHEFTLLAIDLPFHGRTEWNEGLSFDTTDLLAIIGEMDRLEITGQRDSKISLLGFSLGGRIALSLLEKIPGRIGKMVLLAPDGLKVNTWYWLATQNRPGNRIFHLTMKHPGWFFFILRMGHKLRLINPSVYKFTANYINNLTVREELYLRWTAMRRFRPGIAKVKSLIISREITVRLLYGQYDRIIRSGRGMEFRKGIQLYCGLSILAEGHQLLQTKHLGPILKAIKD
jgi:pimeloyl-ACP methyl ester carboxylesterase